MMNHPLYPNKSKAGNIAAHSPKKRSSKINIPNAIIRKVKNTINLLGGVHAIYYHRFLKI
jgi:hypothetical protein